MQTKLPLGDAARPWRPLDDLLLIRRQTGIVATCTWAYERSGSLLFVHFFIDGQGHRHKHGEISKPHRLLFKAMTALNGPDQPGSITVMCVWGATHTHRTLVTFSEGEVSEPESLSTAEWQARIFGWLAENKRR